jgi:hypothetical protein
MKRGDGMKKGLAFLVVGTLLFAACGRERAINEDALTTSEPSAAPTSAANAGESAKPAASAPASAAPAGAASAAPSAAAATSAPVAAAKPPPEGRINAPRDGAYVYSYSGTASDPFNPTAPPQKFNGELTNDSSHSGAVYTSETTNSESPGRTTIRTRWSSARVEMLSLKQETPAGDFSCTFNPPLLIIKFPVKPETYPQQQLKGSGNACNGTLDIQIVNKQTVTDGTGKSWSTWQVKVRNTLKSDQLTVTQNETRWVSPELGTEVRANRTTDGKYAAQSFKTTSTAVLKKHP